MNHLCPKCSTMLTKSMAISSAGKMYATKLHNKYYTPDQNSELCPYVCPDCGFTEWYVEEPEKFK